MDLTQVLAQLRQELDYIDAAIVSLERLQARSERRVRPPKTLPEIRKLQEATAKRTPPRRSSRRSR